VIDAYDARMVALARDRATVQVRTGTGPNGWTHCTLLNWRLPRPGKRAGRYAAVRLPTGHTRTVRQSAVLHPEQAER